MPDFTDQISFSDIISVNEFARNPEPRCPCLLLLDTSGSMSGRPINELNAGITSFKDDLMTDEMAFKRVEIAIVTFGPVRIATAFQTAEDFQPLHLTASGDTPMGQAIEQGLDLLRSRKEAYRQNGISYFRPWIFLITDGEPTDQWHNAAELVRNGVISNAFKFSAVGVEGANMEILRKISVDEPLRLKELRFRELFLWLSNSLGKVSHSNPGDRVLLLNPATPGGWTEY